MWNAGAIFFVVALLLPFFIFIFLGGRGILDLFSFSGVAICCSESQLGQHKPFFFFVYLADLTVVLVCNISFVSFFLFFSFFCLFKTLKHLSAHLRFCSSLKSSCYLYIVHVSFTSSEEFRDGARFWWLTSFYVECWNASLFLLLK